LAIEVTGYKLKKIARRDPAWIGQSRNLVAEYKIELIVSGYSQMIGPLVPARVMTENLRIGNEVYRELLDVKPAVALVNRPSPPAWWGFIRMPVALPCSWIGTIPALIIPSGMPSACIFLIPRLLVSESSGTAPPQ
jgi:hypothetical protein